MAEHDYVIANQNGANTRSDLNNALAAIVSNNSKATEPTTTYAYMWWADTANDILKQRNAADSAWISILTLSTGAPLADYADNALSGNAIDGGTISNFTSTGIDDNATSTAITIDASENVGVGITSPTEKLHIVVPGSTTTNVTGIKITNDQDLSGENVGISFGSTSWGDGATIYAKDLASDGKADLCFGVRISGAPTEKARITANGLTFNGDTAAANALDDYEEGTWTPVYSAGGFTNATYSAVQYGSYTKVGNKVHVQGRIILTGLGSLTGSVSITGLPFTANSTNYDVPAFTVGYAQAFTLTAGSNITGYVGTNTTIIYLHLWDSTGGTTGLQASEMTATSDIMYSADYTV